MPDTNELAQDLTNAVRQVVGEESLGTLRERWEEIDAGARRAVKDRPLVALGAAIAVGLLLGRIAGRR